MVVLMDTDAGVNAGHVKNPQRHVLLTPKQATDNASSGVGPDNVYRDPWGHPYIVTIDLNYDEKCRDAFYATKTDGLSVGLVNSGGSFVLGATVMIWSAGPDGRVDGGNAKAGVNKDNILGWVE